MGLPSRYAVGVIPPGCSLPGSLRRDSSKSAYTTTAMLLHQSHLCKSARFCRKLAAPAGSSPFLSTSRSAKFPVPVRSIVRHHQTLSPCAGHRPATAEQQPACGVVDSISFPGQKHRVRFHVDDLGTFLSQPNGPDAFNTAAISGQSQRSVVRLAASRRRKKAGVDHSGNEPNICPVVGRS